MLKLNSVLLFSENPEKLVEFYKKVLGVDENWSGGDFTGLSAGDTELIIGPHSEVHGTAKEPARIMINFEVEDVMKEFERIKGMGTKVVAEPYHPMEDDKDQEAKIATFEDPDGNYFQVASPFKE